MLLVLFVNSVALKTFSQYLTLPDSLKVDFVGNRGEPRIVNSQSDLNYMIVITNMSKSIRKSYEKLYYDDTSSPFANYYYIVYKKIGPDYLIIPARTHSDGSGYIMHDLYIKYDDYKKADSAFAVYDLPKKDLSPGRSDTLRFNFLLDYEFLDPGEYGILVFLRVNDYHVIHYDIRQRIGINYVNSDMYYFGVTKSLQADNLHR
jgi:hypothetical protein